MKEGDRVVLSETMDDLVEGRQGVVMKAVEIYGFKEEDKERKNPMITEGRTVLAVIFDGNRNPSIGRMVKGKYQLIIEKCKPI